MEQEVETNVSSGTVAQAPSRRRPRGFLIFLMVLLVAAIFMALNFQIAEVKGVSMEPTFKEGRRVLTSKAYWLVGKIQKNDIVVAKEEDGRGYFIKRVYGLPGDKIEMAFAPYDWDIAKGDFVVPEGGIYLIGDNIRHSDDSRKFGPFKLERILGKVLSR
jgi:signal peptidase I